MDSFTNKMLKGIMKVDAKKDICHYALIIKVLMQYFFLENSPQIPTMSEPTKAQQASTSKANALELKDKL